MDRRSFIKSVAGSLAACGSGVALYSAAAGRAYAASEGFTLIVPGPGGSRSGVAGRILAGALQTELQAPVQFVPVDSPREGYLMLESAPKDGSTLGLIGADMSALHRGIGGSPHPSSVVPVALLSEDPAGIHVRRDAPWQTAGELLAHMRTSSGKVKASGAGRHAVWHLSAQRFAMAARVGSTSLVWDAAPSPAAAAADLVAGGPDIVVCSVPEVRATPHAKNIRTLAVMASGRSPRYPDVASVNEAGVALKAGWWRGVAVPRGTPPQNLTRLQSALQRVHASEAYRREMARRGYRLNWSGAAQFAQFVAQEDRAVSAAIQSIGNG